MVAFVYKVPGSYWDNCVSIMVDVYHEFIKFVIS